MRLILLVAIPTLLQFDGTTNQEVDYKGLKGYLQPPCYHGDDNTV